MQFLKNKHLILAMFVAPMLAIIAYFSVDYFVSETPHAAIQGNSYKLAARSNCRYKSGICTLENGDIEVKLRAESAGYNQFKLSVISAVPVQSVLVSFIDENSSEKENSPPIAMLADTQQLNVWSANIKMFSSDKSLLRLALNISDTLYYAEVTTIFINFETSFPRKNFSDE